MAGVDQIYLALEKLKDAESSASSPSAIAAVEPQFDTLIGHVHNTDIKVRNLLAAEIPNYLHWFPSEPSMNAMLDLCEDTEAAVRMSAIRGLKTFCEKSPSNVGRISDVLGQLLGTEDGAELKTVQSAFAGTLHVNFSAALTTLVELIVNSETAPSLRERQMGFLKEAVAPIMKEAVFMENVPHQRTLLAQWRLLLLNETGALLPIAYVQFLIESARSMKLSRSDPTAIDSLTAAILECFELHAEANTTPLIDLLDYFASLWKKIGVAGVKAPGTSALFLDLFIRRFLPLFTPSLAPELSDSMQTMLRMLTYAAEKIPDPASEAALTAIYTLLKQVAARPKPVSTAAQIAEVECVLAAFVALCAHSAGAVKTILGVFVPTGQPSDFRPDFAEKRDAFEKLVTNLNSEAAQQLTVLTNTCENYQRLLLGVKDKAQQAEMKRSVQQLKTPIKALQNIVAMTKAMVKGRPTFTRSGIVMSWQPQNKPAPAQQQRPQQRKDGAARGQHAGARQAPSLGRKDHKKRPDSNQNVPSNPQNGGKAKAVSGIKRQRQIVVASGTQPSKKHSFKRNKKSNN